jgi:hypothetical protein
LQRQQLLTLRFPNTIPVDADPKAVLIGHEGKAAG